MDRKKDRKIHITAADRRKGNRDKEKKKEIHKEAERLTVCHAVTQMSERRGVMSGIGPHLPPAVCHSEGDRHGWPFAPIWWRLLAVPQNNDLKYQTYTDR